MISSREPSAGVQSNASVCVEMTQPKGCGYNHPMERLLIVHITMHQQSPCQLIHESRGLAFP
jgi:hypothetical protein